MPEPVAEVFFYPYLIVDIFSRKIVGWVVHERECAELAAILIRQVVMAEGCIARPLVLHANKGSPMKGDTMKTTMEKLGITASYSRPRVSNDNPFSEALFQTCKYRPNWPTNGFATKADAQAWVKSSAGWYNGEHLHRAIRFVTPSARHTGHVRATLVNRARLYANAWAQNPHRWSGKTRNWQPDGPVWLDRERETSAP
jgi:putative transposase